MLQWLKSIFSRKGCVVLEYDKVFPGPCVEVARDFYSPWVLSDRYFPIVRGGESTDYGSVDEFYRTAHIVLFAKPLDDQTRWILGSDLEDDEHSVVLDKCTGEVQINCCYYHSGSATQDEEQMAIAANFAEFLRRLQLSA